MEQAEAKVMNGKQELKEAEEEVEKAEQELEEEEQELEKAEANVEKVEQELEKAKVSGDGEALKAANEEYKNARGIKLSLEKLSLTTAENVRARRENLAGLILAGVPPLATGTKQLSKLHLSAEGVSAFLVAEMANKRRCLEDLSLTWNKRCIQLANPLFGEANAPKTIFVRECYSKFASEVLEKFNRKHEDGRLRNGEVLIAGNGGIGKSVFGVVMALELADSGKIVLYEYKQKKYLLIGKTPDKDQVDKLRLCSETCDYATPAEPGVYAFKSHDVILFDMISHADEMTHVQDLGDNEKAFIVLNGNSRKLILSSPNIKQLRKVYKMYQMLTLFMPRWTLEELRAARDANKRLRDVTDDELARRFEIFNGIPAVVLDLTLEQGQGFLNSQLLGATIAGYTTIKNLADIFRKRFSDMSSQKRTSFLIHVVPALKKYVTMEYADSEYADSECVFASEYVLKRLADQFVAISEFNVQAFDLSVDRQPKFMLLRSFMLESLAHKRITQGCELKIQKLGGRANNFANLKFLALDVVEFDNVKDLMLIEEGKYYRPLKKNYPTVDSFVLVKRRVVDLATPKSEDLVVVFFQVTVSLTLKVNGSVIEGLQSDILDKLEMPASPKSKTRTKDEMLPILLVFVTSPNEIASSRPVIKNEEGDLYAVGHEPKIVQFALLLGSDFDVVVEKWKV